MAGPGDENIYDDYNDDYNDDNYDDVGNDADVLAGPGERKRCATDRGSRTS